MNGQQDLSTEWMNTKFQQDHVNHQTSRGSASIQDTYLFKALSLPVAYPIDDTSVEESRRGGAARAKVGGRRVHCEYYMQVSPNLIREVPGKRNHL